MTMYCVPASYQMLMCDVFATDKFVVEIFNKNNAYCESRCIWLCVQPAASYMHGAVSVDDYMVLVGGIGVLGTTVVQLCVFMYACSEWTDVTALMARKFRCDFIPAG